MAQSVGSLRGQVLDPSGSFIPKASVTVSGPNNTVRVAETDSNGMYTVPGLAPGHYLVRASAAGFGLFEGAADVPDGRFTTVDIHLAVALDKQEVTVEDRQQVELDPSNNASATVLKGTDLDVLSDNPDDLQADLLALAGPSVGPNGGQIFVDGFSNGTLPPKENIREIRINSNPFSSEFDRVGFGRIEVLTRPGTDRLRGNAGFNFSDAALNARNPYATTKPDAQQREFQFGLSGSLNHKTSFNTDAQHERQDTSTLIKAQILDSAFQPVPVNQVVLTPNIRTSFSPRIDYAVTPNLTVQGRYNWSRNTQENGNVGGYSLLTRATKSENTTQGIQLTETQIIGTRVINESRFQYRRQRNESSGSSTTPTVNVLDSFTSGGAPFSANFNHDNNYEFQNFTSYTRGVHFLKVGLRLRRSSQDNSSTSNYNGTYTFTSLDAYSITLQGLAQGKTLDQIRALGGGARQYSVTGGTPLASVTQTDVAPFIQDDWKVRPNLTLSLGLRYELQSNISDHHSFAPRVGLAWGIGPSTRGRAPKTVLRLGIGTFFDRIDSGLTLQSLRQDGITQQFFVVTSPNFFPVAPPVEQLIANRQPQAIRKLYSDIQSPQIYQRAITIERQLPKGMTASVNYTNSRGVHQLRSRNINAPLPGTGAFPYGNTGQIYLYESSAIFKQSQLSLNVNARVNTKISLFGNYTFSHASSSSDGSGSFPANNYDLSTEWGRAGFDVRHRVYIGGNVALPFGVRVAPTIMMNTASPVNITSGTDLNADTNFNDRPAFATVAADKTKGVYSTPWGVFNADPVKNPQYGSTIIPRNYGYGYGRFDLSGRLSRSWSFGERRTAAAPGGGDAGDGGGRGGGPPGGGPPGGGRGGGGFGGGRGGGGFGGGGGTGRYTLTLGVQFRNALNHVNPGAPVANLSSPFLGQSLNLGGGGFGGGGGGGGGQSTVNRRLELSLRLNF